VDLNFIMSGSQLCRRSPRMVRSHAASTYELVFVRTGRMQVSGLEGLELVPAGGFSLLRNDEPYEFRCLEPTDALTAHFDEAWLRRWIVQHENFTRVPQQVRQAWGAPLAALLQTISDQGLAEAVLPRSVIADQIGALFALMSRPSPGTARTGSEALLARMRRLMQDELGNSELSPGGLAERCGISKRHLHNVFAQNGTTFGRELIELRLRRAQQMLSDPRYRSWTIGQVALECGFADQSHFSRRFHQRFGTVPSGARGVAAEVLRQ